MDCWGRNCHCRSSLARCRHSATRGRTRARTPRSCSYCRGRRFRWAGSGPWRRPTPWRRVTAERGGPRGRDRSGPASTDRLLEASTHDLVDQGAAVIYLVVAGLRGPGPASSWSSCLQSTEETVTLVVGAGGEEECSRRSISGAALTEDQRPES